jgi:hypothetical protein
MSMRAADLLNHAELEADLANIRFGALCLPSEAHDFGVCRFNYEGFVHLVRDKMGYRSFGPGGLSFGTPMRIIA